MQEKKKKESAGSVLARLLSELMEFHLCGADIDEASFREVGEFGRDQVIEFLNLFGAVNHLDNNGQLFCQLPEF